MSSKTIPSLLQNPDLAAAYQDTFDALGRAYWDASDIASKDLIHGTQEAIAKIITAIDEQDLASNTALLIKLTPKIKAVNTALEEIKDCITKITKNIDTAADVISTVSKLLSLMPGLV
jgi:hypothetical protein